MQQKEINFHKTVFNVVFMANKEEFLSNVKWEHKLKSVHLINQEYFGSALITYQRKYNNENF